MRVIFLDFDGVLNSDRWRRHKCQTGRGIDVLQTVDPEHVARLNTLIERTGAKVVVSSTWRLHYDLPDLRRILGDAGFKGEVIGITPSIPRKRFSGPSTPRGVEIQAWLDEAADRGDEVESFVMLDDEADPAHLAPRLVRTMDDATGYDVGLLDEHVEAAVKLLEEPYKK